MTFNRKLSGKTRALAYLKVTSEGKSHREVANNLQISVSSVHRCCKEGMGQKKDVKVGKRGRPRTILNRDAAQFMRTFQQIRDDGQNHTVKTVMVGSGMTRGSYRSFVHLLTTAGYKKLQPRKKGLLSKKDKYMRKVFAKQSLSPFTDDFWRDRVAFCLDAVSFVHKYNPLCEASKPRGKVWGKRSEGL